MTQKQLEQALATADKAVEKALDVLNKLLVVEKPDADTKSAIADARVTLREEKAEYKIAEKELAVFNREAKRQAKAEERENARLAKIAEREANKMPEQNGITWPKEGTVSGGIFATCEALQASGGVATIAEVIAEHPDINPHTVRTQYQRWRKFQGISGRVSKAGPTPAKVTKKKATKKKVAKKAATKKKTTKKAVTKKTPRKKAPRRKRTVKK